MAQQTIGGWTPVPPTRPPPQQLHPLVIVLIVLGVIGAMGVLLFGACMFLLFSEPGLSGEPLFRVDFDVQNDADAPREIFVRVHDEYNDHYATTGPSTFWVDVYNAATNYSLEASLLDPEGQGPGNLTNPFGMRWLDGHMLTFENGGLDDLVVRLIIRADDTLDIGTPTPASS